MAYDYEGYEQDGRGYDPADPNPGPQSGGGGTPGRGRRRASGSGHFPEQAQPDQGYPQDSYPQQPQPDDPYEQLQYPPARYEPEPPQQPLYDPQWEQSGLGWDQREWVEAQHQQEQPQFLAPPQPGAGYPDAGYPGSEFQPTGYPEPGYPESGYPEAEYRSDDYTGQGHPAAGYAEAEYREPGYPQPGYPEAEYEPGYEEYPQSQPYELEAPPAVGRGTRRALPVQATSPAEIPSQYGGPDSAQQSEGHEGYDGYDGYESAEPFRAADQDWEASDRAAETEPQSAGGGAFGAAGLAVVTAIAAVAAAPVLAIVVGASQVGLGAGWAKATGASRRDAALPILIALCATALAYLATPDNAAAASAGALGLGFTALAAERIFGGRRSFEALAGSVGGALLAAVPAGFVVAERQDSALTAGCALAGALAVLCPALLSGAVRGPVLGMVAATLVGGLTAASLSAHAGLSGGLLGGALAGICAVTGTATAGRLAAEGAQTRLPAQALPVALTALGAVIAATVLR